MDEWEERNTIVSVVNIILSGWGGKKKKKRTVRGKKRTRENWKNYYLESKSIKRGLYVAN